MTVLRLLQHRLVLVTGKGGVGKSTCALALAMVACRQGKRVLLCDLGARCISCALLATPPVGHAPARPTAGKLPNLWVAHLDSHLALAEYLTEQLHAPRLVKLATENRVLARLWQAAPSVNEMAILNSLYQLERALEPSGKPRFDVIIVDMPPSGHALTTLGVPRGALGMVRVGALLTRVQGIDRLLHDRERTAVCIVTLPEALPVNEAIELATQLRERLDILPSHVLINRIMPELLNAAERQLVARLKDTSELGPGQPLIDAATQRENQRQIQLQRMALLKARIATEFVEIAETADRGLSQAEAVADGLLAPA